MNCATATVQRPKTDVRLPRSSTSFPRRATHPLSREREHCATRRSPRRPRLLLQRALRACRRSTPHGLFDDLIWRLPGGEPALSRFAPEVGLPESGRNGDITLTTLCMRAVTLASTTRDEAVSLVQRMNRMNRPLHPARRSRIRQAGNDPRESSAIATRRPTPTHSPPVKGRRRAARHHRPRRHTINRRRSGGALIAPRAAGGNQLDDRTGPTARSSGRQWQWGSTTTSTEHSVLRWLSHNIDESATFC